MPLKIVEVSSFFGINKFISSQWDFYKNDPNFVPPLKLDRRKLLNTKKNPFFKHSEIRFFIAIDNSQIRGRIAGIINHNHNKTHNDKVGFFGFFECVNDSNVSLALFSKVEEWLKEKGMESVRGPVNPSMNDENAILIDGFDLPPVLLMPYNPKYYQNLIEGLGYKKAKDLFAYHLVNEEYVSDKMLRMNDLIVDRYELEIRSMDFKNKDNFKRDLEDIKKIYNEAWEKNWGHVKMTSEEFDFLASDLKGFADPNYVLILKSKGILAGFALGLPNLNEVLIHNKSGGLLGALFHLLTKKKKIKMMRILVLGVLPEFRGKGFDSVLYNELGKRGLPKGIKFGEASWILEDNYDMIKGATQIMKGKHYKTYRIFEKEI